MITNRKVKKLTGGKAAIDGAGVHLVRVLGHGDTTDYDPFLMLDAFDSRNPDDYTKGFPWHPHRGIETITYLIRGDIEHGDSLGNRGSIKDGDCQWMTAGSGIIHQEMPQACERMLGAQLWLNLPAKDKMTEPAYGDITAEKVPVLDEDGAQIRVVAGSYRGHQGAFSGKYVPATYLDVELAEGKEWCLETNPHNTVFLYAFTGEAVVTDGSGTKLPAEPKDEDLPDVNAEAGEEIIEARQAVLFTLGDRLCLRAIEPIRFILLSAPPLREPIAWGGPIVMNTRAELERAFRELDDGTFIR